MAESQNGRADEAPTMPVSSLRSMFESKAASNLTASSALARIRIDPPTNPNRPAEVVEQSSRGSLDLPKRPSAWSATESATDILPSNSLNAPSTRLQPSRAPRLQRPLSMNSISPPHSPPQVTIQSPSSPPKASERAGTEQTQVQASNLAPRLAPSLQPLKAPTIPPRGHQRLSRKEVDERSVLQAQRDEKAVQSLSTQDGSMQSAALNKAKQPPPINRADKPKIASMSATMGRSSSLGPAASPAPERISPFNTPPSSDDDSPPSANVNEGHGHNAQLRDSRTSRVVGTSPPSISNEQVELQPPGRGRSHPNKADARNLGFSSKNNGQGNVHEERPGLPPRREPERQPASRTHQSPARLKSPPQSALASGSTHQRIPSIDRSTKQTLIPPKRVLTSHGPQIARKEQYSVSQSTSSVDFRIDAGDAQDQDTIDGRNKVSDYPDIAHINRRPPLLSTGVRGIETDYDARLVDICDRFVCTAGYSIKAWDPFSGQPALNVYPGEKDKKITALAFKPVVATSEEGSVIWTGTNQGELQEWDIATQSITQADTVAHERRTIVRIHRHQNAMWTLDEGGRLCVWSGGSSGLPDLRNNPKSRRVPRGSAVSLIVQDKLWLASGKEIRVFHPNANDEASFAVLKTPLSQAAAGAVTSAALIDNQRDRVYFGHADGKISIYNIEDFSCLSVVNVSVYKIVSLAGVGFDLWAGYNTGLIYVYDTRTQPWKTKKEWAAHHGSPVLDIVVDRSSLWKSGCLRAVSIGSDSAIRLWDGTLENDWREGDMQERDVDYCVFREMFAKVVTWNAGAATPTHLRYDQNDSKVFEDILQAGSSADLLVFGFQELVDLEDKKLTAKSLFKGSMKKETHEHEHVGRQYRAWRDYLVRCVEDCMPAEESYSLVHTSNMVGLFSCVFVKASLRSRIRAVDAAELKRGMGGLHGNKGALIIRIIMDDSSVCLVNCHLAAGQTKTADRNSDITAILETALLPPERDQTKRSNIYVGGGDGSLILDNEICLLNGDLNYRIDTMGRDIVVKAINAENFSKLLERDQLLVSRRRNPGFRLLSFRESPITFAPTYKYDVGSDNYDTSEKRRAPAWCDRVLYRGPGKIKQLDYCRHELRASDHRPVSATFKMRVKQVLPDEREQVNGQSEQRFARFKEKLTAEAKIAYLRDVLGVSPSEAKRLL